MGQPVNIFIQTVAYIYLIIKILVSLQAYWFFYNYNTKFGMIVQFPYLEVRFKSGILTES